MKKNFKKLLISILSIVLISTVFTINPVKAQENDFLNVNASAAILVDYNTGQVIYQKNADVLLPIASMTKMMSEYLILEAINEGRLKWDDQYNVSEYVYRVSQNRGLSNVPLRADGTYSVKELYEAMAIYSANGATIALAEMVGGSESNFVRMMNDKGAELGLGEFEFVNTTGLNNSSLGGMHPEGTAADAESRMSAEALAKLAYFLVKDFPELLDTASIPFKKFREGTTDEIDMPNWNRMVSHSQFIYPGADGIKTGFTSAAGYSFTGTAKRDDLRLISVVMNAKNADGNSTEFSRFRETEKMFNYGFTNYSVTELFPAGFQLEEQEVVSVTKGKEKEVSVETSEALKMLVKRAEEDMFEAVYVLDEELLNDKGELTAPIEKGTKIGYMTVNYTGNDLNYLFDQSVTVDLVTTVDIEKANWFVLATRGIGGFFGDIWSSVASTVKGWF
ncbi:MULTISPECIES: D-alanyl-D-alanine carboxypeptidase family protein [Bacillus]|uniref:D-alanyl-D-alanine carboxypeptidase family protein n=1 Tax=Bacillus TaxID=1386 RepID=UPI000BB7AA34|nr:MULTISPECIES: D-alanyl-D-alanine carboxypeptidase family protein [Bacillus]